MLKPILFISLMLSVIAWLFAAPQISIQSPRIGHPIISSLEQSFGIDVFISLPFVQPDWRISLTQGEQIIPLKLVHQSGYFKRRILEVALKNNEDLNKLSAKPYTLVVEWADSRTQRESAVFFRTKLTDTFNFIHLADLVIFGTDGAQQKMQAQVDEINLIRPDFVVFSGDLAKGGRWEQYREFISWMKQIEVPIILGPGNHAYDGLGGYLTLIGKPNHLVKYGDWCLISLNSGHGRDQWTVSQYDWFESTIEQCPDGKIIVHSHHPLFYTRHVASRTRKFISQLKDKHVPLMLHGHWHQDAIFNEQGKRIESLEVIKGIKFITTTTAGDDLRDYFDRNEKDIYHGYRLIQIVDGDVESYSFDLDADGHNDAVHSAPWGSATSVQNNNSVTISNEHNSDLVFTINIETEHKISCLSDNLKPYESVFKSQKWQHIFNIAMKKQSSKNFKILQGVNCQ